MLLLERKCGEDYMYHDLLLRYVLVSLYLSNTNPQLDKLS